MNTTTQQKNNNYGNGNLHKKLILNMRHIVLLQKAGRTQACRLVGIGDIAADERAAM